MRTVPHLGISFFLLVATGCTEGQDRAADPAFSAAIAQVRHSYSITAADLQAKADPRGRGTFVYNPQTMFPPSSGVERRFVWLVINQSTFPLTRETPGWRNLFLVPEEPWSQAGLAHYPCYQRADEIPLDDVCPPDKYTEAQVMELVFGG